MFFLSLISAAFLIITGTHFLTLASGNTLDGDIYNVAEIEWLGLQGEYQKLNEILVNRTKSQDPQVNFEIALEELIKDAKAKNKRAADAKKLFLALGTLKDVKCNSLSNIILRSNYNAGGFKRDLISTKKGKRRVDKIYIKVLEQHSKDCQGVYKSRVAGKLAGMDRKLVEYVTIFAEKPTERYLSDEFAPSPHSSLLERLHNIIFGWRAVNFSAKPQDVYNALKVASKGDLDAEYLSKIDDERGGSYEIDKEGFKILYERYITKPCEYYVEHMKDVFEVAKFEMISFPIVVEGAEDMYKAWAEFELCQDVDHDRLVRKTVEYINGFEE